MPPLSRSNVAVIGAGPAGLMAAEVLARGGVGVVLYDAMPSAGRKLLMAGRGGLNLTHSEALSTFLRRYREAMPHLEAAITAFPPDALRQWSEALGQPTFTGTSGRVFPRAFKASPLLRAWLQRLAALGVQFELRHRWTGWHEGQLSFQTPDGQRFVRADTTVLALGGASWPRLGSDGAWAKTLAARGVTVSPFKPANCGFTVAWSDVFHDRFNGHPLKGVELSLGSHTARGEALITRGGIEGGAVYALSAELRSAIGDTGQADLRIALRPDLAPDDLIARLSVPRGKQSLSNFLRKSVHLPPVAIGLLQEAAMASGVVLSSLSPESWLVTSDRVEPQWRPGSQSLGSDQPDRVTSGHVERFGHPRQRRIDLPDRPFAQQREHDLLLGRHQRPQSAFERGHDPTFGRIAILRTRRQQRRKCADDHAKTVDAVDVRRNFQNHQGTPIGRQCNRPRE